MVEVSLLGTAGTMPVKGKWLSSAMIRCLGYTILIDCGEGTQMAARAADLPLGGIDIICLTHFHGDHIAGLPGMLLSMGHEGRTAPVDIYGPAGLKVFVEALCILTPSLPYELRLHEIITDQCTEIKRIDNISISAFPLSHSVPCLGYTFDLNRPGKFDPGKAKINHVPMQLWSLLQKQDEVADSDGAIYYQNMVLGEPRTGIHVLYATDTRPTSILEEQMKNRDLCILEGMYGNDDKRERAVETFHMTFTEVAFMASRSKPSKIWLTHFSPALPDPENYIEEAQSIFPDIELGTDGKQAVLKYRDEV